MTKSTLALAITLAALATEATAAGFIEDSKASIGLRNFYYDLNTKNTANNNGEASLRLHPGHRRLRPRRHRPAGRQAGLRRPQYQDRARPHSRPAVPAR